MNRLDPWTASLFLCVDQGQEDTANGAQILKAVSQQHTVCRGYCRSHANAPGKERKRLGLDLAGSPMILFRWLATPLTVPNAA